MCNVKSQPDYDFPFFLSFISKQFFVSQSLLCSPLVDLKQSSSCECQRCEGLVVCCESYPAGDFESVVGACDCFEAEDLWVAVFGASTGSQVAQNDVAVQISYF
jgi:hypothetical protein